MKNSGVLSAVPCHLYRLSQRFAGWQNQQRILSIAQQVAVHSRPNPGQTPIVFFNATARLNGLSQNAAFSLLTTWGLRLAGVPVTYFVCNAGMSHCVLGTNRADFTKPPPCQACITQSRRQFTGADVHWFTFQRDSALAEASTLAKAIQDLSVVELGLFEYPQPDLIPLGRLVLPAIRWALRCHHLPDDEATRYLFREYILSAYGIVREFGALLERVKPETVVIFNGIMYPEAAARWIAQQRGIRVVTHEVGFQRFSAFFTDGEATAYPIHIPDDFELTEQQNDTLDAYLEKRFQGQFTMAGIRFWPEMRGLDDAFLRKTTQFCQIVPIFTNVVFDTSQVHANTVFPHMFAWLDLSLEMIRAHPETLFVIRAHPDEMRPGTAKQSRESVHDWVYRNQVDQLSNVVFIDSQEYVSSYELIQRSKFVIVYNSSIGLEAALMGKAVLCGGKARYTQYPIVFFPGTVEAYRQQAEALLRCSTEAPLRLPSEAVQVEIPQEFSRNARRFLYYQLFRTSLPYGDFLEAGSRAGFVQLKSFSWRKLSPEYSQTIRILRDGILEGKPFLLEDK